MHKAGLVRRALLCFISLLLTSIVFAGENDDLIPVPGLSEDEYELVDVIGQHDLTQSSFHSVTNKRGMHLGGVHVHKYDGGARAFYVYDSGNNRILAFLNPDWTSPLEIPDLVFGQNDSFESGACNGDNNYLNIQPAARTLCINSGAFQISQEEEPKFASMDTDANGNFYLIDQHNSRVLMFLDPFGNDSNEGDTTADAVWGQADFNTKGCNRGSGAPINPAYNLTADRICTTRIPGLLDPMSAVSLDIDSWGNMWVTDIINNRLLRFPFDSGLGRPASAADIVLGQPDLTSFVNNHGACKTQPLGAGFCALFYLKVHDTTGEVYVMHHWEDPSIWVFAPNTTASNPTSYTYVRKIGDDKLVNANFFTFLDDNRILVTDHVAAFQEGLYLFDTDGTFVRSFTHADVIGSTPDTAVNWFRILGQFSIVDNYLVMTEQRVHNSVLVFDISQLDTTHKLTYAGELLGGHDYIWNTLDASGVGSPFGFTLSNTHNQIFVSDGLRILVWSMDETYAGKSADFVIGQGGFNTKHPNAPGAFIFKDKVRGLAVDEVNGKLWVSRYQEIYAFDLPITTNAPIPSVKFIARIPNSAILGNLPVRGQPNNLAFLANSVAFNPIDQTLWIVDNMNHRAAQVTNPHTTPQVNLIVGQNAIDGTSCNRGTREAPTAKTLCAPGTASFDNFGNLYIAEGVYEGSTGNKRIVEYDKATIDAAVLSGLLSEPAADRVYAVPSFTTNPVFESGFTCMANTPCNPMAVSFDSRNRMVVLSDAYFNARNKRVFIYHDPLKVTGFVAFNMAEDTILPYSMGQGAFSAFDDSGRMYLQDHTWNRIMVVDVEDDAPPNTAPILTNIGDRHGYMGKTLSFDVNASDADTPIQTLSFSLDAGAPAGTAINPVSGLFSWDIDETVTPGNYLVTVIVADNGQPALTDSETVMLTIGGVNSLANPGFENPGTTAKLAAGWTGANLSKNDRRVCDTATKSYAREGLCAYRFSPSIGVTGNRLIKKSVNKSEFVKGDTLELRGAVSSNNLTAGARLSLIVTYNNQTQKIAKLNIPSGAHEYQLLTRQLTLERGVKSVQVRIETRGSAGVFFVDDLGVIEVAPGTLYTGGGIRPISLPQEMRGLN